MKRALAVAFLLGLTTAAAVAHDDDDRRWRNNRGRSDGRWSGPQGGYQGRGGYGGYGYGSGNVVGRAIQNLRYAASRNYVDGHERNHFERAMYHLQRFNSDHARGNYRSGHLQDALENMSHLANARQLHPRDRQIIASDMSALRSLAYGRGPRW